MLSHYLLAIRLLKRDWNAGELKILVLALLIAVASITSIGLFTQRIERTMTDQSSQFLGADLLLKSPTVIDSSIIDTAKRNNLNFSSGISFSSVLVANNQFQLTHVKAVDQHYPLLSQIKISQTLYGDDKAVSYGPAAGDIWIAPRLFSLLGVSIGDEVELGETKLRVASTLKYDPGQTTSIISIAPHILMNMQDIPKTGIIQPGSRVTYLASFSGKLNDRTQFLQWLKPRLSSSQHLIGGTEGSEAVNTAMNKAEQYLSLSSMLSVMLSGIAIAMAANRYGQRHFNQAALMRCMGATQKTIVHIFTMQLLVLGTIGSIAGCLAGYLAQEGLVLILSGIFITGIPAPGIQPLFTGFISGLITLTGFSLPSILRLKAVSPLRVLRKELTPLPISAAIIYSIALISLVIIMWWHSGQFILTLLVLTGTLLSIFILFIMSLLILSMSKVLLSTLSGPWKIGFNQIIRNRKDNLLQILAFGLSLMILMTIYLLRTDLISRWQNQLPENAPNHFLINIQKHEAPDVDDFFTQKNIKSEGQFPMVRGRITSINNTPILEAIPDREKLDASLKRELNLSWSTTLQKNNRIIEGKWWDKSDKGEALISIEQGLARRLQVTTGDTLTFKIADQSITAMIKSIRTVQWDSFQPNFYIIFPDNVINTLPVTYISSFYLEDSQKNILNQLIAKFPTLTVLEIDAIMKQVKSIMQQVSMAIEYVMLFVLFAGIMVLTASMQSSMDERINTAVIMRTLGAKKSFLVRSQLSEFILLGLFSGILATSCTELIAYLLYSRIFALEYQLHLWLWIAGPIISILMILIISWFYMKNVTQQSPAKILRYT